MVHDKILQYILVKVHMLLAVEDQHLSQQIATFEDSADGQLECNKLAVALPCVPKSSAANVSRIKKATF